VVFLPIVARELRVAARRRSLYRLRWVVGCLTLGLGAFFLLLGENLQAIPLGAVGRTLFLIVSVLLLAGALAAAHQSHDCISGEKREGTLGFLFLTDLNGFDIVLGKLCAAGLPFFYAMMASFPLLAAAALLGGVTGAEIWRTWLAVLNVFFFAQSAAMLSSSIARAPARAAQGAAALLAAFIIGFPLLGVLMGHGWRLGWEFNPIYTFALATRLGGLTAAPGAFGWSLICVHLTAWIFLALASLLLPRLWHDKPEMPARPIRWGGRALLEENPFYWLASRGLGDPRMIWALLGLLVVGLVGPLSVRQRVNPVYLMAGLMIPHALLKFWVAAAAGRSMEARRRDGSLEMLLAGTPLTSAGILDGQWRALRRLFLGPVLALLLVDFTALGFSHDPISRAYIIGTAVQLPVDLAALIWLAMWCAMSHRAPGRATFSAMLRVCIVPNVFLYIPMIFTLSSPREFAFAAGCWALGGWTVDIIVGAMARGKLRLYLRDLAASDAPVLKLFAEPIPALAP
jgi:hypothetical protein